MRTRFHHPTGMLLTTRLVGCLPIGVGFLCSSSWPSVSLVLHTADGGIGAAIIARKLKKKLGQDLILVFGVQGIVSMMFRILVLAAKELQVPRGIREKAEKWQRCRQLPKAQDDG